YQVVRSIAPVGTSLSGYVPWGKRHHQDFKERFNRTITFAVIGEDLPEVHNKVSLDTDLTDADGIPAPRITYTLSDNSRKILDHGIGTSTQVMEAAGATKITANPLIKEAGWHLMGTARMGTDKGNSVVDGHGRSHEVKNLFVVDGSIFVTAGAVNPTSTIQALALYIADYVKDNARHLIS
ncbi:MAG TPA: choline dehydrogenase, partial [Dehalococcoidia bacterium]|nr:choline dehydrogenase [Dehalococcoidia bacterium]